MSDQKLGSSIRSSLSDEAGAPRPLHISLSQTLLLQTNTKDAFHDELVDAFSGKTAKAACTVPVRPFTASFDDIIWAANHERTRWFLALKLERPSGDELNRLLDICNQLVASHGLPQLYTRSNSSSPKPTSSDRFHFSLAWTVQGPIDPTKTVERVNLQGDAARSALGLRPTFQAVKIKVGNAVTSVALDARSIKTESVLS